LQQEQQRQQLPDKKKKKERTFSFFNYSEKKSVAPCKPHRHRVDESPVRALVSRYIAEGFAEEKKSCAQNEGEEKKDEYSFHIEPDNDDGDTDLYERVPSLPQEIGLLHEETKPIFVISTGRGKVRAGIFSRRLLMTAGMGPATAYPFVKEAWKRNMHLILIDPNAHGERFGFTVFKRTWRWFFPPIPDQGYTSMHSLRGKSVPRHFLSPIYVLAHSMAGSQLVRSLHEMTSHCENTASHFQERIKSIAFTDSTHNLQWVKENIWLCDLVQSPDSSLFFTSLEKHLGSGDIIPVGKEVETDVFWNHRFGNIETVSAGTLDHQLTNYSAQKEIWKHFDKVLL